MGSDAHVFIWQDGNDARAPDALLDEVVSEIDQFERLWSRFLPTSDVSRLNTAAGDPVPIAPETMTLLQFCREATRVTDGRFDPSVLPDLIAAGYDRSFELLGSTARTATARPAPEGRPIPRRDRIGLNGLVLDRMQSTATIPRGAAIDLGGVAKGWTGDLIAHCLVAEGAVAACVNLGGDLATTGCVPEPDGLLIGVEDPFGGPDVALLRVQDQGVATTARTRRRWTAPTGAMHHLIDPATGQPAATGIASVTATAPTGAWAEIVAKAVFLAAGDPPGDWLQSLGASALIIRDDRTIQTLGELPTLR